VSDRPHEPRVPDEVVALVEFTRALAYGRPSRRTTACMISERRGTCSAKHRFLHDAIAAHFPELEPRLVHRVYRAEREAVRARFGERAARAVPEQGLVDVHRYLEIRLADSPVRVDATFPGAPWDGRTSMPLACGPGTDHPVTGDCDAEKRGLEQRHCDPAVREPFIAALGESRE
jgi:hypothetical protein